LGTGFVVLLLGASERGNDSLLFWEVRFALGCV
jgi:hypothetical protein